jgi:hypothetical protein
MLGVVEILLILFVLSVFAGGMHWAFSNTNKSTAVPTKNRASRWLPLMLVFPLILLGFVFVGFSVDRVAYQVPSPKVVSLQKAPYQTAADTTVKVELESPVQNSLSSMPQQHAIVHDMQHLREHVLGKEAQIKASQDKLNKYQSEHVPDPQKGPIKDPEKSIVEVQKEQEHHKAMIESMQAEITHLIAEKKNYIDQLTQKNADFQATIVQQNQQGNDNSSKSVEKSKASEPVEDLLTVTDKIINNEMTTDKKPLARKPPERWEDPANYQPPEYLVISGYYASGKQEADIEVWDKIKRIVKDKIAQNFSRFNAQTDDIDLAIIKSHLGATYFQKQKEIELGEGVKSRMYALHAVMYLDDSKLAKIYHDWSLQFIDTYMYRIIYGILGITALWGMAAFLFMKQAQRIEAANPPEDLGNAGRGFAKPSFK